MPTGYTAGILDGTTKDFKEYAKLCTRAFMIHLRDEPFDSKYEPRTPSDYHLKAINKAKEELSEIELLSDSEIIEREKLRLLESVKYHKKSIVKSKLDRERLEYFLSKAEDFKPPTEAHEGIADFMKSQINETIRFDCGSSYHSDELEKTKSKLLNINAENLRSELIEKAKKDLLYHTKEHETEVKRCIESNKWYEDFISAL